MALENPPRKSEGAIASPGAIRQYARTRQRKFSNSFNHEVETAVAGNKILKMNAVPNDCVSDLSVGLLSSLNIPISTNTVISFTQTGTLSHPHWDGFFPTLFRPPGY